MRFLFTSTVRYDQSLHEADRNLMLLKSLGISPEPKERPIIVPSASDERAVDTLLKRTRSESPGGLIAVAPGSVWFTKRWPAEQYAHLVRLLEEGGKTCVIVGGASDVALGERILAVSSARRSFSAAGVLSIRQSAALIRRCACLVTNDSAPLHLGVAMGTRVVALFGPTVPSFGFAPYGPTDEVVQIGDLHCRPCTKHGGPSCPIGTFECMLSISPAHVASRVLGSSS